MHSWFDTAWEGGPDGARRSSFDFPIVDKPRAFRCIDTMRPIAERLNCSVAQLALAWNIRQPGVIAAIAGSRAPRHAWANAEAAAIPLRHLGDGRGGGCRRVAGADFCGKQQ